MVLVPCRNNTHGKNSTNHRHRPKRRIADKSDSTNSPRGQRTGDLHIPSPTSTSTAQGAGGTKHNDPRNNIPRSSMGRGGQDGRLRTTPTRGQDSPRRGQGHDGDAHMADTTTPRHPSTTPPAQCRQKMARRTMDNPEGDRPTQASTHQYWHKAGRRRSSGRRSNQRGVDPRSARFAAQLQHGRVGEIYLDRLSCSRMTRICPDETPRASRAPQLRPMQRQRRQQSASRKCANSMKGAK